MPLQDMGFSTGQLGTFAPERTGTFASVASKEGKLRSNYLKTQWRASMQFTRRQLFKSAGAAAVAGVIGSQISQPANAHGDIDEEIVITTGEMFFQQEGKEKGAAIRVPANKVVRLIFKNGGV